MYNNSTDYLKREHDFLEIRMKRKKEVHLVEYFDGIRIDPSTVPEGKHLYHTRHSDTDITSPVSIVPEGQAVIVNFCGSVVTDKPLEVKQETKLMYVSWI